MALDRERWQERGHHVRVVEALCGALPAPTYERAKACMRLSFLAELAVLPHDDREAAVDLAAAGYVAEHLEAGGSFASR